MDGLILIDKKEGVTSYDAVMLTKRIFHTRKVGHCGTLDPFASGLLIIGINQATKVMTFLEHDYKEYVATIKFGKSTDTYDITGKVISESNINKFSKEQVIEVLEEFVGEITQVPPIYSSIHIDGKKAYEYARNNQEVTLPERQVTIHDINLLDIDEDSIKIYVKCSRGTYIRTLGVDIAKRLNNDGCLSTLRRISIGGISVERANTYEQLEDQQVDLIDIKDALRYKKLYINDSRILKRVYNGQNIILKQETEDDIIIVDNDNAVAIYKRDKEVFFKCIRGLYDENIRLERLKSL